MSPAAERGFLLDTLCFLWLAAREELVPEPVRERLAVAEAPLWLSVASVWEMAIKKSLGKLEIDRPLGQLLEEQCEAMRLQVLEIRREHALAVESLPWHHRDPFDRLLVAQAIEEDLGLVSADATLDEYGLTRVW
jgi:PIN domain nuclease of toxin-antitoxin system